MQEITYFCGKRWPLAWSCIPILWETLALSMHGLVYQFCGKHWPLAWSYNYSVGNIGP